MATAFACDAIIPRQSAPQRRASRRHHARSWCTPSNSVLPVRRKSDSRGLSIKDDLVKLELVSRHEAPARAFCLECELSAVTGCHRAEAASRPFQYLLRPVQVAVSPSAGRLRPGVLATAWHRQFIDGASADRETVLREKFRDLGAGQKLRLLC